MRLFACVGLIGAAPAHDVRAADATKLTPTQQRRLDATALGAARTSLLATLRALPLDDGTRLDAWIRATPRRDRAFMAWVRSLPQPWRGIIDGGVVLGLIWGLGVIWWLFARYLAGAEVPPPNDLPLEKAAQGEPALG